jgi:ADP-ribosylglycohydrolase
MTLRKIQSTELPDEPIPPAAPATVERYQGAILGCALGDAVGAWCERRPADEARDFAKYFVREFDFSKIGTHHHGMRFGQYTDDTQLTRELSLSLIDEGGFVPEDFADRIANAFAKDEVVGYGGATQEAAVRLIDGTPWNESGTPPPRAGNGAAMRAGPIGLFFYNDTEVLIKAAADQAIITHTAPMSVAAAVAVATATAMALSGSKKTTGPHEPGWWSWLAQHVQTNNEEYAQDIRDLAKIVFEGRKHAKWKAGDADEFGAAREYVLEGDDMSWDGVSPYARTSTLWSLYCVMAAPFDVWKAIEIAIAVGGDSDTIAAMAATIVGAHVGLDQFPKKVIDEVAPLIHDVKAERYPWEGLAKVASNLHEVVSSQYQVRLADWKVEQAKVIPLDQGR